MYRQEMKKILKTIAKPVKRDLFEEIGFNAEELALMKYLYIDNVKNQDWVCDELGISIATLTKWHNQCINQLINFFNYQKYKLDNSETSCFGKYFNGV